jgi:hypothetical protein
VIHLQLTLDEPQFSMGEMVLDVCGIVMELAEDFKSFLFLAFGH